MTQRISLDTLHGAKEPLGSFAPCAFSNGETNEAPECSAALVLSASLERFRREAHTGVCDTGRYRLTFRAWGQGPALIVVPGVAGNLETHVLPLSRLSRNFCCISYTLPAGGDDGATLANLTHDDLVADVVSLADHLGVKASAVWGTSFGATIALAALAKHPDRFTIGILQTPYARRPLAPAEALLARFARYWPGTLSRVPTWLAIEERAHAAEFAALEPARWPFYLETAGKTPIAALARRAILAHRLDLRSVLPTIQQPAFLISGEYETAQTRARAEEVRAGLPSVARAEIDGCGDLPHLTHPEVLCEAIEQFMGVKKPHE